MSGFVPLIAGGLLALAELAFWLRRRDDEDPRSSLMGGLAWAGAAGLGGVFASALVLIAATATVARSVLMTVGGTAAAVIVVAMLSRASRRWAGADGGEAPRRPRDPATPGDPPL